MTMANPFYDNQERGTRLPGSLPEIDALKERVLAHITRVTVEHAGLPDVIKLLDALEHWRDNPERIQGQIANSRAMMRAS